MPSCLRKFCIKRLKMLNFRPYFGLKCIGIHNDFEGLHDRLPKKILRLVS